MKRFFIYAAMAFAVMLATPQAQAQEGGDGLNTTEQRQAVFLALLPVQQDLRAQILDKRAELDAETDPTQRALLLRQLRLLGARVRYISTLRFDARYRYSTAQLNTIILRYDLNVSLS